MTTQRTSLASAAASIALHLAVPLPASAAEEVPFITTPDHVTRAMLDVARVKAGDHVIDLGSGDGRIVITAARMGATGLGVEIVPDLVEKSRVHAQRAGVADKVEFRQQDLFDTPLDRASVVTMYLLPELNLKLRARLLALPAGTRVVSHDWDMGDWRPDRTVTLDVPDKVVGREKLSRVHLWVVPARVHATWCAEGWRLDVDQRFQRYSAVVTRVDGKTAPQPAWVQDGTIDAADGVTLRPGSEAMAGVTWRAEGERSAAMQLRVVAATGTAASVPAQGVAFVRAQAATCP